MARVDVIMPQMGESIAEGTVSRWLKAVGDTIKRDEAILEISTDKVDAEIPSPAAGVLAEIKVQEGETVEVLTVIAVLETDSSVAAAAPTAESPAPAPAPVATPAVAPQAAAPTPAATPTVAGGDDGAPVTAEERLRQRSTPLVRKIAAEHKVDISRIRGTGYAGRVTKKDILSFIEAGGPAVPATAPPVDTRAPAPAAGGVVHPSVAAWEGDRVEPMTKIRKLTADHMIASRRTSAHVTSFYEIDFTRIARMRQANKQEFLDRGAKLTYMAFIVKAVADNLQKHPALNASVSGDNIIYRKPINIGLAVALDWGLIVPVMRGADELSVLGIAKGIVDLAERARSKRLNPDEVQYGTFTVTNPGVFGSYIGTPIINQPEVAILGVGAIEKRPKVLTLDDGQDVIAIRTMSMFSISYDHRIVDGADADRFMADLKTDLENFPEEAL
ncbi:MAG: 2-oxoglutarate dehydrogenase, E2 component, dihydrolipoamide succinyltransferase [Gemmatimonadetes bacterium]|nr:2-oxoglutarate dehydrogenase, E2 component, dihydrolipoamide succinyltransferase [Gemmatimonadota bacterium]